MVKISGKSNEVIKGKKFSSEGLSLSGCKNCRVEDCDFSYNKYDTTMLTLSDCVGCTVIRCKFHDKDTLGVGLKIDGSKSKDNVVEDCDFENPIDSKGNEYEPVRLGNSRQGHIFFNTKVINCRFKNLASDPETISIKSCGNVIEKCKHINNKSSFVIRHGHTNTIQDNEFEGEGGIRVYGKDNKILRNMHKNNQSTKFPPLTLVNGGSKDEPGTGKGHASYTQVRNNVIEGNTYENCIKAVVWGRDSRTFRPEGVQFIKNKIVADKVATTVIDFSGGATPDKNTFEDNVLVGSKAKIDSRIKTAFKKADATQPDPVVITPPPVEPEPETPVVTPPEQPQIEPTPDTDPIAILCSVCNKEEAKKKLSILVCTRHADAGREDMKKLLTELQARYANEEEQVE